MLLGYHTNGLQNHRFDAALALLAGHGFAAVAITPDTCHLDPDATTDAALDEVARRLRDLRLRPVIETGARFLLDPAHKHEPTLMTRDPAARARRLAFYRRVAAMGRRLGAEVVSFWAGIDHAAGADSAGSAESVSSAESADWLREGVRRACAEIRAEGMVPSLEPEPGMAVETFRDWQQLARDLGSEAPRLTLDVGHLYAVHEGDPLDILRAAGPHLSQVHLEDHRRGVHEHLEPGAGEVDFDAVLSAIEDAGYSGPVCFELSRSSHRAPLAVANCRAVWDRWRKQSRR